MARTLEDYLSTALGGFSQGYGKGPETGGLRKTLLTSMLKQQLTPQLSAIPEGYEVGYGSKGQRILQKTKKPTFDEAVRMARGGKADWENVQELFPTKDVEKTRFNLDIKDARSGRKTWDDLYEAYPHKRKEIEEAHFTATPIMKAKGFTEGRGLPALFSKEKARITLRLKEFISAVDNEQDYKNALSFMRKKSDEFTQNDINTFLEYFGRR